MTDAVPLIGDFSIFGYTKNFEGSLKRRINDKLGILPRTISMGNAGELFLHTTYGELGETNDAIAIKLGLFRSLDKSPLTAQSLLATRLVGPGFIDNNEMRGNGLIICLGKSDAKFAAFKTMLGVPQLYYYEGNGEIICSDRLNCLVKLLNRIELNDDVIPMHFLFRSIPGNLTYYQHIKRMLPGQKFRWGNGQFYEQSLQCLKDTDTPYTLKGNDPSSLGTLFHALNDVVGDYYNQAETSGQKVATLLSGGVDSTLLQYFSNIHQPNITPRSYSYAIDSTNFQREIMYAQAASDLFHTDHTFVSFTPMDFAGLLTRTVDILAQPPILETEPSMLSIAEYVGKSATSNHYFISGQGADTVFGLTYSLKLKGIEMLRQVPASAMMLKGLGKILSPGKHLSTMLIKGSNILLSEGDGDSFLSPSNSIAVYGDIEIVRRCFGDETLIKALQYRRDFASNYLKTNHYLEKVHVIDLMTDTYELGAQRQQIFLAHGAEQLHPFFDDDILRVAFSFAPDYRYIKGFRPKYLLKDLLTQKTDAVISKRPKGFSIFESDLISWMKSGPLRELIENIERPGFLSKLEFDRQLKNPDYSLWILLNWDIFRRRCFI